ncbi:extracellular solute-binding protein [Gracilibacillus salitolerans]|uniref:Extracellular solute-binding protein n=1 Tax=Gracilibacillus salitolerans TaxID=2663022 RepID=A0A5Q2TLB4_9BACI|nr:ABC transporter substrate-binding protein [Gracilibacillus salitolerans]QGH35435.1 extracellular solute-binding protein [Gracilibacillus salitolerans]
MKPFRLWITAVTIIILVGCHSSSFKPLQESSLGIEPVEMEENAEKDKRLVIWTHSNIFEDSLPEFLDMYSDVEVDIKVIEQNLTQEYRQGMLSGKSPDLYVLPDYTLGEFTGISGFENLYEEKYYEESFFDRRPESLLNHYIDEDKNEMFAIPLLFFPYVTYYRADILNEYGYPSDPIELSNYINNHENWLNMAQDLKENGHYIVESEQMMLEMVLRTSYLLDEEYNYLAKEEPYVTTFNTATEVVNKELSPYINMWDETGKEAFQNDELVMFQMASYVTSHLKEWVPEQNGKWGITTLPFQLAGVDKQASMSIAISEDSNHKELAWAFAKKMADDMLGMYEHPENDPFFINEDLTQLYWIALNKDVPGKPQSLDQDIQFIWDVAMKGFNSGNSVTREAIENVNEEIMERIKYDQRALQKFIKASTEEGTAE